MVNKIARMLIKYKAIEFGDFTLASGAKSPYYIDVKSAATNPEFLASLASEIAKTKDFDSCVNCVSSMIRYLGLFVL